MSSIYSFRCATTQFRADNAVLVLFSGPHELNEQDLRTAVAQHTKTSLAPEATILLIAKNRCGEISEKKDGIDSAILPLMHCEEISVFTYDEVGKIESYQTLSGAGTLEFEPELIKRQGLTQLFRRRGGLLEAGATSHFVKPSHKKDKRFLRAANALSEGPEIFFVALWLLPFFKDEVRGVHLDTSDISSVAFAAFVMRGLKQIPMISTFHSYEGLEKHEFRKNSPSVTIISASQSGGMAAKILERINRDCDTILTLFSLVFEGNPAQDCNAICDLTYNGEYNKEGYQDVKPVSHSDGSRPIELVGQHFLAKPNPSQPIVPTFKDPPKEIEAIVEKLQSKHIFSALVKDGDDELPPFDLDFDNLKGTEIFEGWIQNVVARSIPATLRGIFVDEGNVSRGIADAILDEIKKHAGDLEVDIRSIDEISTLEENKSPAPLVVIEGLVSAGIASLDASRALRTAAPNSHRIYLSAAVFPESSSGWEFLQRNLRYPKHHVETFFSLPVKSSILVESWKHERGLLRVLSERDVNCLQPQLSERQNKLIKNVYLKDGLFLDGFEGPLELRNNFAFWPNSEGRAASQADVFLTMASILENMRTGNASTKLLNDVHNHSVISVEAFGRYNDGIIQAAILRSAHVEELNYAGSAQESNLMQKFILQMVRMWSKKQGEAVNEFLLALASKRINLHQQGIDVFKKALKEQSDPQNPVGHVLIDAYISGVY